MQLYLLIPLFSCVFSAILMVAILTRDPGHRANRLAATLVGGVVVWSFCEVIWNSASDPDLALRVVRLSSLGWVCLGPLGLHLLLEVTDAPAPLARRLLPLLYGLSGVFLAVALGAAWIHTGVVRTSWGWGYRFGPSYLLFYGFTVACLVAGLRVALEALRRSPSAAERSQARWLMVGVVVPLVVASLSDGLLPFLGFQPPRLGTASFVFLGVTIAWSLHRYGYSVLAPGAFAREILETLPDGVALLRLDGRVRWTNGGLSRLAGREQSALEDLPITDLLEGPLFDPPQETVELGCDLLLVEGERIPVSVSSSYLRDKQGLPIGLVVVLRDQREVVALRNRLVTSGRLAAVGELAAGIAHEINNPMAFVRTNLGTLRAHWDAVATESLSSEERKELRAEGQELIDECLEGVDRVSSIVRDVKGFSHAGSGNGELVDLNALLDAVLRVAGPQLRHRARIERDYGELPLLPGAGQELKQVFLNLVVNAGQSLPESGGTIRLTTRREGGRAEVCVEDDGCGIPREAMERIFDPFFTTKPVGEGTGLGLAISYQIVRSHRGEIQVESEPRQGTRVRVRLPLGEARAARTGPSGAEGALPDPVTDDAL